MSRTLAGTLLRPDGEPVGNAKIYLTAKRNEINAVLMNVDCYFETESNGSYSQVVQNGYYAVALEYTLAGATAARRWNLGDINVDSGSTVSLNELLQFSADPGSGVESQIQQWYEEIMAAVPEVEADKNAAQAAATAAAGSASSASSSASAASSSATAAAGSATTATTQATNAGNSATAAAGSAATATTQATNAGNSATAAAGSATAAANSATAADASADAAAASAASTAGVVDAAEAARDAAIAAQEGAETAETNAQSSESAAQGFATAASGSATAAAGSATAAAGSATTATNAATASEDSADESATSATAAAGSATAAANSATAAQGFRDEAEDHKDAAAGSATAASGSATAAAGSATAAAGSATTASTQATNAGNSATAAAGSATAAETSAVTASDEAVEAAAQATAAAGSAATATAQASQASDSAAEAVTAAGAANTAQLAAESARDDAAIHQSNAEAAAGEAALWENIAMQFAQNPEDVPVVDGDSNPIGFSALHWAAKAEESAGGGITPATVLSFLTDKQGAAFGSTSTMSQALQTLVDGGIGGINTFPETLSTAANFEDFWAIPQGKPYMVTGGGAVATYLNSLTSSLIPAYAVGNANSRDVLVKTASMQWAVSGITYRKVMFSCKNQGAANNNLGLTMTLTLAHRSSDGVTQALMFQPAAQSSLPVNQSCGIDRNRPYVASSRDPKFDYYLLYFQRSSHGGAASQTGGFTINADVPANSSINLFLNVAQADIAVLDPGIQYFIPTNNYTSMNCVVFPVSSGAAGSSSISAEIIFYAQFISGGWQFSCTLKNTSASALPAGGYIFNGGFVAS